MDAQELQEALRKQFPVHNAQWRDNRRSTLNLLHHDFDPPLWLNAWHKPVWVDLQSASLNAGSKTTLGTGSTPAGISGAFFAAADCQLELGICANLSTEGLTSDAVDVLDSLVQGGCHVPSKLFSRVLKRCIEDKDLTLGRRIHSLTLQNGYGGNPFLATRLIALYAWHDKLEEAMGVFTRIPAPNAYNWASIIFAHAKRGKAFEASQAIRLYRQMCDTTTVKPDDRIYSAALKACAAAGDLVAGREVHAHTLASLGEPDRFVRVGLVDMYAKCGSLVDARRLFDELSDKDVVAWTTMITGYTQHRLGQEALDLYKSMQQEGLTQPNVVTFVVLLQACSTMGIGVLDEGRRLHEEIKARGLQEEVGVAVGLIDMYAKCGSLEDARRLFETLSERNIVTWTVLVAGYAEQGMGEEALSLYRRMKGEGITPNSVTYVGLLRACANIGVGALHEGKQLHAEIEGQKLQEDLILGGSLVNMYAKCGNLGDARRLFDALSVKNIVAWNAMISGYAQQGLGQEALSLYSSMKQEGLILPDYVTFVSLLQACASVGVGALDKGKELHARIREQGLREDTVLGGSLVNMYAKCGRVEEAREVFDKLSSRDVVTWTAMIAGYAQRGMGQEALRLYEIMKQGGLTHLGSVTYACLTQACASIGIAALEEGRRLHAEILKQGFGEDVVVGCNLIDMYTKCGRLEYARSVSNKLPERNVVVWTAMIAGYAQHGMGQEALTLYRSMQQEGLSPNSVTYACVMQACASIGNEALDVAKQLIAEVEKQGLLEDLVVAGSIINMFAQCGMLEDARCRFDELPKKSTVAWTAMIAGYAQQGMGQEALSLYCDMKREGIATSSVTFVSVLQACASIGVGALDVGSRCMQSLKNEGCKMIGF